VFGYSGVVSLLTGLILFGLLRGDLGRLRPVAGTGLRVAVGMAAAHLLVLLAFQHTNAGNVATFREVSVLPCIWLAGECPGRPIWACAVLVVTGVLLVAV
jgi:drug/metabolite transporter (DMT)-like permease